MFVLPTFYRPSFIRVYTCHLRRPITLIPIDKERRWDTLCSVCKTLYIYRERELLVTFCFFRGGLIVQSIIYYI